MPLLFRVTSFFSECEMLGRWGGKMEMEDFTELCFFLVAVLWMLKVMWQKILSLYHNTLNFVRQSYHHCLEVCGTI